MKKWKKQKGRLYGDIRILPSWGKRADARSRRKWGSDHIGRLQRLCARFASLRGRPGTYPWRPLPFLRWAAKPERSVGERQAALLVLLVADASVDWNELARREGVLSAGTELGAFNVVRALDAWTKRDRASFQEWVKTPFFSPL